MKSDPSPDPTTSRDPLRTREREVSSLGYISDCNGEGVRINIMLLPRGLQELRIDAGSLLCSHKGGAQGVNACVAYKT